MHEALSILKFLQTKPQIKEKNSSLNMGCILQTFQFYQTSENIEVSQKSTQALYTTKLEGVLNKT